MLLPFRWHHLDNNVHIRSTSPQAFLFEYQLWQIHHTRYAYPPHATNALSLQCRIHLMCLCFFLPTSPARATQRYAGDHSIMSRQHVLRMRVIEVTNHHRAAGGIHEMPAVRMTVQPASQICVPDGMLELYTWCLGRLIRLERALTAVFPRCHYHGSRKWEEYSRVSRLGRKAKDAEVSLHGETVVEPETPRELVLARMCSPTFLAIGPSYLLLGIIF